MKKFTKLNEFYFIPVAASMIMMSHLSDVEEEQLNERQREHIEFVKYLILNVKNTDQEINPNEYWEKFKNRK